jgi:hypothetical protein
MNRMKISALAAVASAALVAGKASASFIYTTSFNGTGYTASNGDTVGVLNIPGSGTVFTIFSPINGSTTTFSLTDVTRSGYYVPGTDSANFGDYTITTNGTAGPTGITDTLFLTDQVTLTNVPTPGTAGSASVTAFPIEIDLANLNSGNGTVGLSFDGTTSGSTTAGGINFTVTANTLSTPTVDGSGGNVGGVIAASVPEPASLGALAVGGLLTLRRRRRRAA